MKRPSRTQWYEKLQKNIHIAYVIHHLSKFKLTEQIFIALLVLIAFLFVFFSLVVFEPLSGGDPQYIGLLSGYFGLTSVVIAIALIKLLTYNTSFWVKELTHTILGIKDQDYLYNMLGLLCILISLLAIQDMVGLTQLSGSSYSLTSGFYMIQIVVIGAMIYSLVLAYFSATTSAKKRLQPTIHYQSDENTQHKPTQTLFE